MLYTRNQDVLTVTYHSATLLHIHKYKYSRKIGTQWILGSNYIKHRRLLFFVAKIVSETFNLKQEVLCLASWSNPGTLHRHTCLEFRKTRLNSGSISRCVNVYFIRNTGKSRRNKLNGWRFCLFQVIVFITRSLSGLEGGCSSFKNIWFSARSSSR